MPQSKVVKRRGSVMVVEATAEVLFAPGGPVANWSRQFSNRLTAFTRAAAPRNSRPTWLHEPAAHGRSLKRSITSSTRYDPKRLRVFTAVGSSSKYSAFVDQGTGIYAGHSPWEATILPPTGVGSPSLYEHTWRPAGPNGARVAPVMIRGQRPQFYFARGLEQAFASVHMATAHVPGAGLRGAVDTFPGDLIDSVTAATEPEAAFLASLKQWREWRDAAWTRRQPLGGENAQDQETSRRSVAQDARRRNLAAKRAARRPTAQQRTEDNRLRQQRHRANLVATRKTVASRSQLKATERTRFVDAAAAKYGRGNLDLQSLQFEGGYWYMTVLLPVGRGPNGTRTGGPREIRGRKVE